MIPAFWLSRPNVPTKERWDEQLVERLLDGRLKRPAGFPTFTQEQVHDLPRVDRAVVVFPAGSHVNDIAWLNRQISKIGEVVLILTSDEAAEFPVEQIKHRRMHLWVQTPLKGLFYPPDTTFLPLGAPQPMRWMPGGHPLGWCFIGQADTPRRREAVPAMEAMLAARRLRGTLQVNDGFASGMERDDYLDHLSRYRVGLCPAGAKTQDTFRLYESIEMGLVPIVDAHSGPDRAGDGFWDLFDPPFLGYQITHWADVEYVTKLAVDAFPRHAAETGHWWHRVQRNLALTLMRQLGARPGPLDHTVVMTTSPIPSNPSIDVIVRTINAIREYTDAEILVLCDGVRPEQNNQRRADYYEALNKLMVRAHHLDNVTPILAPGWLHQAGIVARALEHDLVASPWLLFAEHDTPLVGDIDLHAITEQAEELELNLVRFLHEPHILEEHAHLHLPPIEGTDLTPTMQWSQRPHLARTDWYRDLMLRHFEPEDRTMIEDVLHGAVHPGEVLSPRENQKIWDRWRMAVYTPPGGSQQRSDHYDGRDGDPKFPMRYRGQWK